MSELTPMMRQYMSIKDKHPDSILFFRLGDFYEMFFDDAVEASRILNITLTSRGSTGGKKVPMCGIPFHAADNYIARLLKKGEKVAICEQVEEPSTGKKIVKREVIKIITPGTFIEENSSQEILNNYILSIFPAEEGYGIAYADISTGEYKVTEIHNEEDLFSEIYKISPSECLMPSGFEKDRRFKSIKESNPGVVTMLDEWTYNYDYALKNIKDHFKVKDISGFGCQDLTLAVCSAGALLKYLKDTQKNELANMDVISTYKLSNYMTLDWNSHRNLELVNSLEDMSRKGTLLELIDKTTTPMGKRIIKRWLMNPLIEKEGVDNRLNAVGWLIEDKDRRDRIKELLHAIYDIDRLTNKLSMATANARDLISLANSLENSWYIKEALSSDEIPVELEHIRSGIKDFSEVIKLIRNSIKEEPSLHITEGGIIKDGFNDEVDELRDIVSGGKDWLVNLQKREAENTGIPSLKVGYNRVFGYYIEVTNTHKALVPEHYVRKQTLTNAERYITEELKSHESKIIGAQERIKSVEYDIFVGIRQKAAFEADLFKKCSSLVGKLDALVSLAEVAFLNGYKRPEILEDAGLEIIEGRHPVLEKLVGDREFVPNDVVMGGDAGNIFIITGSNMAGKSTFIRQVALITIMAQMGSFVPAKKARIGIVDRVFTRVGASDRLYKGMSTFMVEMLETANILNNATKRSLIILDEIGRGTSTYDGVSIAWAVIEYLNGKLKGAKTLFATHFHEITELSNIIPDIKNYNLAIKEWGDEIIFLYKVVEGSCDDSFGIHVAKLAGMPKSVVERAREILANLQKDSLSGNIINKFAHIDDGKEVQFDFFGSKGGKSLIEEKIKEMDINKMTPVEALKALEDMKKEIS